MIETRICKIYTRGKAMLNTAHLTKIMLPTLNHNLEDQLEVSYNTPYFTTAKSHAIASSN